LELDIPKRYKVKHEVSVQAQWKSEFDKYAVESNGRLTSKIDYFTIKADGRRIAVDSQWAISNVKRN
jgi:hypothetical protein